MDGKHTAFFLNYPKDGAAPYSVVLVKGNICGTTAAGGRYESGTVFGLIPHQDGAWREVFLHVFNESDGVYPTALTVGSDNSLYGVAGGGQTYKGVIYRISPPNAEGQNWAFTTIYAFLGPPDGYDPVTIKFAHGDTVFGTTEIGGDENCASGGCGTVFSLTR